MKLLKLIFMSNVLIICSLVLCFNPQIEKDFSPICDLSQTTYPIAQRRTNTQTQLRRQSASHTHTHAHTVESDRE